MLLNVLTLALLTLYCCIGVGGVVLARRRRGWLRVVGVVLVFEALLALVMQVVLSTLPFGIGEPLIRVPLRTILAQTGANLAAIGGVATLVYFGARWLNRTRLGTSRRTLPFTALALLPLLAGGSMYGMMRASLPERERERDPLKREISLPSGFAWSIYSKGTTDNPTAITFGADGKLYIADISGTLWLATDSDNNAVIDAIKPCADGFDLLVGLIWRDGELYAASSGKIEALRDTNGDGTLDQRRTVVSGLPSMILKPHSNNGFAFGPDGRLYFGVGSTTDRQVEMDQHAAAILSVKPDGTDLRVYARGLGNSFDVAFNQAGDLFAGDNGPSAHGGEEPPDEFNHIIEGGHYGFPYYFGDPPDNGGTRGALVSFPPHSVPTGMTFYQGANYPPEYRDSAFLTLWARGEIAHIEVAQTAGGNYLSRTTTWGSGFLYPIDVITGPDGNLYVADFGTSAVYRITYDPNKAW